MPLTIHPAEFARIQAGYSLEEAARKLKLSPRYLRHLERHGGAPPKTARRMSNLYHYPGNTFIHSTKYLAQLGHGTIGTSTASSTVGVDTRVRSRADRRN